MSSLTPSRRRKVLSPDVFLAAAERIEQRLTSGCCIAIWDATGTTFTVKPDPYPYLRWFDALLKPDPAPSLFWYDDPALTTEQNRCARVLGLCLAAHLCNTADVRRLSRP